jgi:hypothetical protein
MQNGVLYLLLTIKTSMEMLLFWIMQENWSKYAFFCLNLIQGKKNDVPLQRLPYEDRDRVERPCTAWGSLKAATYFHIISIILPQFDSRKEKRCIFATDKPVVGNGYIVFSEEVIPRSFFICSVYLFRLSIIKAPIVPGTQPHKVRRKTMAMEPHPWSKTARGGKKMQRRTRRQDMMM